MLSPIEWAMYATTCVVAAGTPGPGTLAVITSSIQHGSKKTLPLMTGIAFGLGIVSVFALLGLAHILTESQLLFMSLQYVGIAYILFLGLRCIKESFSQLSDDDNALETQNWGILSGIWISVLNPKTFLFFMAFFPTYMSKSQDDPHSYLGILLAASLVACTFTVHIIYSLIGQKLSALLEVKSREINRVTGAIFIVLGLMMAV